MKSMKKVNFLLVGIISMFLFIGCDKTKDELASWELLRNEVVSRFDHFNFESPKYVNLIPVGKLVLAMPQSTITAEIKAMNETSVEQHKGALEMINGAGHANAADYQVVCEGLQKINIKYVKIKVAAELSWEELRDAVDGRLNHGFNFNEYADRAPVGALILAMPSSDISAIIKIMTEEEVEKHRDALEMINSAGHANLADVTKVFEGLKKINPAFVKVK